MNKDMNIYQNQKFTIKKKKSFIGYTYGDYDFRMDKGSLGVIINHMGINIVSSKYRNSSDFYKTHYPKKVKITIEPLI
jgi:hypothetical protein